MGILERGLAKLTLEAYQGDNREKKIGSLTALYNPESISLDYDASFSTSSGLNAKHDVSQYHRVSPRVLRFDLILDTRGPQGGGDIDAQLSNLRAMCFTVGEKNEPPYLRVTWGSMGWHGHGYFAGRAQNLSISYTLFDRDARPLRAKAGVSLIGQTSDEMAKLKALHPPVGKILTVQDKTPLPLLLAQATTAAGCSAYLTTAYANDADNLSSLLPGQTLIAR